MTIANAPRAAYETVPGFWDEALEPDGRPRPASADALDAVAAQDPEALAAAVRASLAENGVVFRSTDGDHEFSVDPIPRVLAADEWAGLERGVGQRVRALNAFVADVYGERRIFAEGVVPPRLLDAAGHEPALRGYAPPGGVFTAVAGLDVVRDDAGRLLVLEDNLTTPSGLGYTAAARAAVTAHLNPARLPAPIDELPALLAGALRAAAPGDGEPTVVLLTDGPENSAFWEHAWLARALGIPLVRPHELTRSGDHLKLGRETVDVVYRRTNLDTLDDAVGALLGPPLRAGTLGVANCFGTAVADDKLTHAYAEDMVRFYLGEAPLLPSVPTLDLGRPEALERALDTLADLVVKPRHGHGGIGVVICADLDGAGLEALRRQVLAAPGDHIAQPRIALSRHPTVVGGRIVPRHVDLRPFVFLHGPDDARVLRGGLTRVAFDEGALVVNSTQNGGAKDTWIV